MHTPCSLDFAWPGGGTDNRATGTDNSRIPRQQLSRSACNTVLYIESISQQSLCQRALQISTASRLELTPTMTRRPAFDVALVCLEAAQEICRWGKAVTRIVNGGVTRYS